MRLLNKKIVVFISKVFILISVCVLVILLMSIYNNYYTKKDPDGINHYRNIPDNIEISSFGNSHIYYGCQWDDFDGVTFNFAISGQTLDYDFAIAKEYFDKLSENGFMIINVSYFSLYGPDETLDKEFKNKNKRYYRILKLKDIKCASIKERLQYNELSILGIPGNLLHYFFSAETGEDLCATNMNIKDVASERVTLHVGDKMINGKYCINESYLNSLYGLIDLCKSKNIRPVIITTPYLREYFESVDEEYPDFLENLHSVIEEVQNKTGVKYCDYSMDTRFADDYSLFMDSDHLNKKGAKKFSKILIKEVIEKEF